MNTAILTIDDIASQNTVAIVDYLNEKGIRAVMFATGANVEKFYDEAMYAVKHGMIVGNHTYSHNAASKIPLEEAIADIEKCEKVLDKLYADCDVERIYRPFRFPYGDKGGENKDALQQYLKENGFSKLNDKKLTYPWWTKLGMDKDIDTFWTFDFEEYRLQNDPTFTKEDIWAKVGNRNPAAGAALFGENNHHFILTHAHDETEFLFPEYYKHFIQRMLDNGVVFEEPSFL